MNSENNEQVKCQAVPKNNERKQSEGDGGEGETSSTNINNDNEINLNEFLDLLNVSTVLNHCIMNMNNVPQSINGSGATGNTGGGTQKELTVSARSGGIDFTALAENTVVNKLLGRTKISKTILENSTPAPSDTTTTNSGGLIKSSSSTERTALRRMSSFGSNASAHYTRAHAAKKAVDGVGITGNNTETPQSTNTKANGSTGLHPTLEQQLDNVINEGVLDSMLPYICPVPLPARLTPRSLLAALKSSKPTVVLGPSDAGTSVPSVAGQNESSSVERQSRPPPTTPGRRKSLVKPEKIPDVVIHVCDEVKNTSRDFTCPQNLLVSKMGYFADVTAGQKLDDMDISVHCDIQIFDWLMRWVKSSGTTGNNGISVDSGPQLDASNVVPILVSASFLQMEPLLIDCLAFCHSRLSEVVRSSANLSCLNDAIVTRLAAMFTNLELEAVRDKRDRVTPRLWTKLIQSLAEPETEALRGHFYTLCGLFRCSKCGKHVTHSTKSYVACLPGNMRLNRWGQLVSEHIRDTAWDINAYVAQLFKELKSWRRVYWRLWGYCHALYCCLCEEHFPLHQMSWCRYHPEAPNFLGPSSEGRLPGPAGRYPCCGQQAFRFETLPGPSGCQFREHSVLVETDRERSVFAVAQVAAEGGALLEPVPIRYQETVAGGGDIEPRWVGMPLTPQRCRQGLLPPLNPDDAHGRLRRKIQDGGGGASAFFAASSSASQSSDSDGDSHHNSRRYPGDCGSSSTTATSSGTGSCSSSDGCESEVSLVTKKSTGGIKEGQRMKRKRRHRRHRGTVGIPGRHWSGEMSARSNQDHQREFEEKVMKHVTALVCQKKGAADGGGGGVTQPTAPAGGTYVRLEAEWREQLKQRHGNSCNTAGGNTSGGTAGGPTGNSGGGGGGSATNSTNPSSTSIMSRFKLK